MNKKSLLKLAVLFICIAVSGILYAQVPVAISNPSPANGQNGVPLTLQQLSWTHAIGSGGAPTGYKVSMWDVPHSPAGFTYKFEMYGKYYYISNSKATWPAAKQACENAGGHLASSFAEQINTLLQSNAPSAENVWIGLSDAAVEGTWVWHDGRTYNYSNWRDGEPNNSGSGEHYVELYKSDGKWNDAGNGGTRYYFLQLSGDIVNIETTATSFYDLNISLKPNTTYYWKVTPFNGNGNGTGSPDYSFTTGSAGAIPVATTRIGPSGTGIALNPTFSWNSVANAEYYKLYIWKARGNPDTHGNSLIGVRNGHAYYKSADAVGLVTWETAKANCESYGAHLMTINSQEENDLAPGDYSYWIGMHDSVTEGEINWVAGEPINYTNWGTNEPNGDLEDYIQVRTDKKWNDNSGSATMRYLLEYPGDVLDGKVIYGTSYSFKDVELAPNTNYFWIAVPYSGAGRPWVTDYWGFTTGATGSRPGSISGISPVNAATGVAINTDLSWTAPSGNPTEYYAYLGTNNTIANEANYTNLGIFNGHRYYRYNGSTLPWCAAEALAKNDGGYLATIGSHNENTVVGEASFGNDYARWFGGNDRMISNVWKYSNGDPWTYTNWWTGEPNNDAGAQYYTAINWGAAGRWDDQGDTASRKFLLETVPNIADGARVTTNSYTPDLLRFNTTYYWSAVASNNYGMANDTQRWSFTTTDGKAVNPSPANSALDVDSKVFTWNAVGGASNYLFYLGTSNGNWNLVNAANCPTNTYTYAGNLDYEGTYYWKVATVSPLESVQGNVWSFTYKAAPQYDVLITSTPSGATITFDGKPPVSTPFTFTLTEGQSATYNVAMPDYTWQLDPNFDSNVVTNIMEAKHIHFIGTFHAIDNGFEYIGEPGVQMSVAPMAVGDLTVPAPPFIGAQIDPIVLNFSANATSNLSVVVPLGTWFVIAYYNGSWQMPDRYPCTHPEVATFANVPFDAKADVPVIISSGDATLPVELSSFTAVLNVQNMVNLNWVTQSEANLSGYYVYRADQQILNQAQRISVLIGATNTSNTQSYNFVDREVEANHSYHYWLETVEIDGSSRFFGPVSVVLGDIGGNPETPEIPVRTELLRAFPNPFNPQTSIRYNLKEAAKVSISIYNAKGQLVNHYEKNHNVAGSYSLVWDGTDLKGNLLGSGTYFYRMQSGEYSATKKVLMMK